MNEIQKFCPLVKKPCAKEQCEFFHDTLKRCQISVISYNIFRLTEPKSSKSGAGRNAGVPCYGQPAGNGTAVQFAPILRGLGSERR